MNTRNNEGDDKVCEDKQRKERKQLMSFPIKLEDKEWIDKYQEGLTTWSSEVKYLSGQGLVISLCEKWWIYFKRKEDINSLMIEKISLIQ